MKKICLAAGRLVSSLVLVVVTSSLDTDMHKVSTSPTEVVTGGDITTGLRPENTGILRNSLLLNSC